MERNLYRLGALLLLAACSGEPVVLEGTYRLEKVECGGAVVEASSGYAETIKFLGPATASYVSATTSCVHRSSITFSIDGSTMDFMIQGSSCFDGDDEKMRDETGCALEYSVAGVPLKQNCRALVGAGGRVELGGDGKTMTAELRAGDETCVATYVAN